MKDLVEEAKTIFLQTLRGVDLKQTFKEKIHRNGNDLHVEDEIITLSNYQRIVLIGMGKASQPMGFLVEQLLEDRLEQGILVTNHRSNLKVKSDVIVACHPVPDRNSFEAGRRIINLIKSSDSKTLIVFVISGGGSSLVESPIFDEIPLEEFQRLNQILIGCGATIKEINVIRKFLSLTKGGRLGNLAKSSHCLGLFLSDVNYGDLQAIASNPLLPDNATLEEFYQIIERYNLLDRLPHLLATVISKREVPPLPIPWPSSDGKQINLLLLENRDALAVAVEKAKSLGFEAMIELDLVEGDYREVADKLIRRLIDFRNTVQRPKVCLISGGEVSCLVKGRGLGGRNQEFVLYSGVVLARYGIESFAILSCGTDGIDGNSTADGAVADASGIRLIEDVGVKGDLYFQENDTHSYFREFGGLLTTGPTGTNVRDVRILLAL
jgi:glycerate 2-kinase